MLECVTEYLPSRLVTQLKVPFSYVFSYDDISQFKFLTLSSFKAIWLVRLKMYNVFAAF